RNAFHRRFFHQCGHGGRGEDRKVSAAHRRGRIRIFYCQRGFAFDTRFKHHLPFNLSMICFEKNSSKFSGQTPHTISSSTFTDTPSVHLPRQNAAPSSTLSSSPLAFSASVSR